MKGCHKRICALFLAGTMLSSMLAGCNSGSGENSDPVQTPSELPPSQPVVSDTVKWSEETTKEGWVRVTNQDGMVLGYSPDSGVKLIESDGYAFKDLNKNGVLDPYEDWRLDIETRAENAASFLSDDEMIAMMLLGTDFTGGADGNIADDVREKLDNGFRNLAAAPTGDIANMVTYSNKLQAYAEGKGAGIPIDLQGEPDLSAVSVWPSALSLASSFDPDLIHEFAKIRGQEYRAIGVTSANMPQIDLATEPRWFRISETFGEDPALVIDMAQAYVNGLQSTYSETGEDQGWGADSVAAYVKHFPSDGPGEGGRESHRPYGKYSVQPGGQLATHLKVFEAAFNLDGKTKGAAGVMPSYSIGIGQDGVALGGEHVGSGMSNYKVTQMLRGDLGFDGVAVTDYGVIDDFAPWGAENLTVAERCLLVLEAGTDKVGSSDDLEGMKGGAKLYEEKHGAEALHTRLTESAQRMITNMLKLGLVDNPYLLVDESSAKCGTKAQQDASLEAQLKSVVLLKNSGDLIKNRQGEKPTVYIPLEYNPATEAVTLGPFAAPASPASFSTAIDVRVASKYFNVVTDTISDTLTGPADENGNPTLGPNDVIRASEAELAACDFALALVGSPVNVPGSIGMGYDPEKEEYIPISLQYGPYTANSDAVRKTSIGGDLLEDGTKENRSYYGKSSIITNSDELGFILDLTKKVDHVVVVVKAVNPMIVSEFEKEIDGLLVHFGGVGDEALCQVLSGQVEPSALLPVQMPANMETVEAQYEDVPRDMECHVDSDGNTYDFAFGLNWSGVIQDARTEKYDVDPIKG